MENSTSQADMRLSDKAFFQRPTVIGKMVGYSELMPMHDEWIKTWLRVLSGANSEHVHLAHRGSYKSTCEEILIAIIMVTMPWRSIGLFRKTDDAVKRTVRGIRKVLESEAFRMLSVDYAGVPITVAKATDNSINTNYNSVAGGQEQMFAQGIGGTMTGQHYDIIITDDICTLEDRTSRAERDRTKDRYVELLRLLNDGGSILHTGTPWHGSDVFSIMPKPVKYSWKDTGMISPEKMEQIRRVTPRNEFAANYELEILAEEDAVFTSMGRGDAMEFPTDGSILYIDPAFSPTGHDYTACVVGSFNSREQLCAVGKVWRKPWNRLINDSGALEVDRARSDIGRMIQQFNVKEIAIETNSLGEMPALLLEGFGMRIRHVNHSTIGKHRRIMTLSTLQNEIVLMDSGEIENRLFNSHILDYNLDAEFRDAPDALAGLVEQIAPEAFIAALGTRM